MDILTILKAALLGILEGLTEFLPVSSTGHIILMQELIGFQGPKGKVFEIVIQLGAILAVCWLYRAKMWRTALDIRRDPVAQRFAANIVIAFLPAVVIGVLFHRQIKEVLLNAWVVSVALIVGGFVILLIERFAPRPSVKRVDDMDWKLALKIGIFQCLAMIPGTSRSAATIMSARVFGADRATAAEFSFFLAIPTMLGAAVYDTFKNRASLGADSGGILLIVVGFVLAFVAAMLVVRAVVSFVSRYGFGIFAWYRIMLGSVALVLLAAFQHL
ncbi:MAG: undecaprenyl-diphosphate phosphatase [Alphaproteobacteria bacterium]|nr:undecaprenyl-diphosphate phosphatase [Alphaproteobacteria bacterium]MCW5739514.1 undecaprenyl-diphosphate phosphatase [Alphaproteobacteria bacterium]